jgi:hypothetical protein
MEAAKKWVGSAGYSTMNDISLRRRMNRKVLFVCWKQ